MRSRRSPESQQGSFFKIKTRNFAQNNENIKLFKLYIFVAEV